MSVVPAQQALDQCKYFLHLLDPAATSFHFRTFDDKTGSSRSTLIGNFNGNITNLERSLSLRNNNEAGVFVVINEGGQKKKDIVRIRAVFADTDGAPLGPIVGALDPHMVIESSPGNYHVYWLVNDGFPLDMFTPIQKAISEKFRTDPNVKDLPRVMRLPGFKHNKEAPHAVQFKLQNKDLPRYSISEIISGLGLSLGQQQLPPKLTNSAETSPLSQAISSGIYTEPSVVSKGSRNAELVAYLGHLRGSGEYEDVVIEMVREFNANKCRPSLEEEEVDKVLSRYPEQANIRPSSFGPDEWPEPKEIRAALSAVPEFDLDFLPDVFKSLVTDASELMQAPPDFIAVPLMVAAAATLGNGWAIAPKAKDLSWKVPAVLWGAIIGRPGTKKSPCMDKALVPLLEIEKKLATDHVMKLQKYQSDKLVYDALLKKAKAQANKTGTAPTLPQEPEEPQPERLLVNDITYQKLGDILQWSPRGVAAVADELVGLLENTDAKGQEGARAFLLAAWNGDQSHRIDRIGRGSTVIDRLSVCVLGGIQPGKLQNYVRQAKGCGNSDDGLMQRFQLLVWPDVSAEWIDVDRYYDQQAFDDVMAAFMRLRDLLPTDVNARTDMLGGAAYLQFDDGAQALFNGARQGFEVSVRSGQCHPALEAHFSKYPRMIAALSLIIHLVDGGIGPVGVEATNKAIGWAKYLTKHAQRAYGAADNAAAQSAKALSEKIEQGIVQSGFTARSIVRKGWQYLSSKDDVTAALEWLIDADWIVAEEMKSKGRPTTVYIINPRAKR